MDSGIRRRLVGLRQRWRRTLSHKQMRWLDRRVPPVPDVTLSQRIIFILPTRQGVLFGIGALLVLGVAIAERNAVALLLSVLMLSLFLLNLVLCYRNLSGLRLQSLQDEAQQSPRRCFVGDTASFTLRIHAAGRRRAHHDLLLGFNASQLQSVSVLPGASMAVTLTAPAVQRGLMAAPRLILHTRYQAGLWQAWSRPDLAMRCLVYPWPQPCVLPAAAVHGPAHARRQQAASARQTGVDDFVGLRNYQPGDGRGRIAWRSLARGHGLKSRQFVREAEPPVVLRHDQFPGRDVETVLSCLCFQVLQLCRRGQAAGLQLPGDVRIKPGHGEAHKHRLLEALALS